MTLWMSSQWSYSYGPFRKSMNLWKQRKARDWESHWLFPYWKSFNAFTKIWNYVPSSLSLTQCLPDFPHCPTLHCPLTYRPHCLVHCRLWCRPRYPLLCHSHCQLRCRIHYLFHRRPLSFLHYRLSIPTPLPTALPAPLTTSSRTPLSISASASLQIAGRVALSSSYLLHCQPRYPVRYRPLPNSHCLLPRRDPLHHDSATPIKAWATQISIEHIINRTITWDKIRIVQTNYFELGAGEWSWLDVYVALWSRRSSVLRQRGVASYDKEMIANACCPDEAFVSYVSPFSVQLILIIIVTTETL